MLAAQQEQQARPPQPRWRKCRPTTHKGELGTVIPNIPTIPSPDQRDSASPDVLVCAYICMKGTTGELVDPPNICLASFSTVSNLQRTTASTHVRTTRQHSGRPAVRILPLRHARE